MNSSGDAFTVKTSQFYSTVWTVFFCNSRVFAAECAYLCVSKRKSPHNHCVMSWQLYDEGLFDPHFRPSVVKTSERGPAGLREHS